MYMDMHKDKKSIENLSSLYNTYMSTVVLKTQV